MIERAQRRRLESATVLLGFSTLLAFALSSSPAQAQYFPAPWSEPYYDGYPPPMPPGPIYGERRHIAESTPRIDGENEAAVGILPLSEIRRRVALMGFHLLATPRHKDKIYLAEAEDAHGLPHRLVFDAYRGTVIENTKLAPFAKKPAKSAGAELGESKPAKTSKPQQTSERKEPSSSQPPGVSQQ
ncbi:MAG TPA: hypothetical protein VKV77_14725 [Methylovirgula sp.]|nr:hypothetical protein [Methylovirgula sp.]